MGFLRVSALVSLVVVALLAGCAVREPLDPVDVLLKDLIEEYGGQEALERLNTLRSVWDLTALVSPASGTLTHYVELPSRLRAEFQYSNSVDIGVLDGERGYRSLGGSPALPASGAGLYSMKLRLMGHYTPLTLLEKRDRLFMTTDGPYKVLGLHDGPLLVRWYVNPGTRRIVKVASTMVVGEVGGDGGGITELSSEYSDFRRVAGGVLAPHKETRYAGGFKTAVLMLKEVSFNEEFDRGLFGAGDG